MPDVKARERLAMANVAMANGMDVGPRRGSKKAACPPNPGAYRGGIVAHHRRPVSQFTMLCGCLVPGDALAGAAGRQRNVRSLGGLRRTESR